MFPEFDGTEKSFEKMKQEFINQGFDWEKGWTLLPFVFAFGSLFKNPDNNVEGESFNGR